MRLFILLSMLVFSSSLLAQSSTSQAYDVSAMTAHFSKLYALDAGQSAQYQAILETKVQAIKKMNKKVLTMEDLAAMKQIDEQYQQAVTAIMNDKQKEAFNRLNVKSQQSNTLTARNLTQKPKEIKVDNR